MVMSAVAALARQLSFKLNSSRDDVRQDDGRLLT